MRRTRAADAPGDPTTSGARGSAGSPSCARPIEDDSASLV